MTWKKIHKNKSPRTVVQLAEIGIRIARKEGYKNMMVILADTKEGKVTYTSFIMKAPEKPAETLFKQINETFGI